jgi:hypothetical protein
VAQTLLAQSQTQLTSDLRAAVPEAKVVAVTDGEVAKDVDVDEQLRKVAKVERKGKDLTLTMNEVSATLDTTQPCVDRLVGEAASILAAPPATLVVLTPRSVSCMHAQYGDSAPTKVAAALIGAAVKVAVKQNADKFSVIVTLPSRTPNPDAEIKPPVVLIESERRLEATKLLVLPAAAGIVNFHIYGWTSVGIILALIATVYSIVAMTNDRDPLLYAKFRPEVDASSRR